MSLQPNSGATGEYAGLRAIQAYHHANGETQRGAQGSADSSTASPRRAQGRDSSK